ncbi:uncharacterized protein Dvir_GJ25884 [Drosophila virilis]|uniref:RING-type domain-containing protein n=1 Tax=Drosophila virilis TaxID=7244 RepID=A0A0Q9WMT9_DROVI|nr:uncharacterized protein Dvir_GJ25884 [Drosophila virilis]
MKSNPNPCIFCLDEQQRPCCLPCSHSFCTDCLERYLQVRGDPRCPLCRREFQPCRHQNNPIKMEISGPLTLCIYLILTLICSTTLWC